MKYLKVLMTLIFSFALLSTSNSFAFADDDYYDYDDYYYNDHFDKHHEHDKRHDENETYKDIGETIGWGTVIAFVVAGLLFPLRRLTKTMITSYPSIKQTYISITKFFGKYHLLIGFITLILGSIHGILMYLHEGRLDDDGISGLVTMIVFAVASIIGLLLFKNKKVKNLRTTHMTLIAFTIAGGLFHIFIS